MVVAFAFFSPFVNVWIWILSTADLLRYCKPPNETHTKKEEKKVIFAIMKYLFYI